MAAERVPEPLIKPLIKLRGWGGGGCSRTCFNFSTVDIMSKMLRFSESLERDLSNDVFKSNISLGA